MILKKIATKLSIFFDFNLTNCKEYKSIYKIGRVPSPRNPAVYKTNLTNRHEKISNVCMQS